MRYIKDGRGRKVRVPDGPNKWERVSEFKYPAGFDISLPELVLKYKLVGEPIKKLRALHMDKNSGLAYAVIGRMNYYREEQVARLLGVELPQPEAQTDAIPK